METKNNRNAQSELLENKKSQCKDHCWTSGVIYTEAHQVSQQMQAADAQQQNWTDSFQQITNSHFPAGSFWCCTSWRTFICKAGTVSQQMQLANAPKKVKRQCLSDCKWTWKKKKTGSVLKMGHFPPGTWHCRAARSNTAHLVQATWQNQTASNN